MRDAAGDPDSRTLELTEIAARFGRFDLVLLEIGAWHEDANALEALGWRGGGTLLPVHGGTFNLAMHAWDEPAETLVSLGVARGASLAMPRLGQPIEPAHVEGVEPWWRTVPARDRRPVEAT